MSRSQPIVDAHDLSRIENLELLASQIVDGFLSGRHRSKLKGGCAEFAEHRSYCPGDEIRLLDWRAYGKSDRYYIKQFEEDTSLNTIMVVDASGSMGFSMAAPSKFVYARAACLGLARLLLRQGDSVGLHVVGAASGHIPSRSQPTHLDVLVSNLKDVEPAGRSSLGEALIEIVPRIRRRGLVLLFSDAFEDVEQLGRALKLLRARRHEAVLFHVLAPEELSFDFASEQSRFESLENAGETIDLDPIGIRPAYLEKMRTFLDAVRRACGEADCEYVPLQTDEPLGVRLAEYLRRREGARR